MIGELKDNLVTVHLLRYYNKQGRGRYLRQTDRQDDYRKNAHWLEISLPTI